MNPLLVTMRGPNGELDVRNLSNFEAGIAFLTLINQLSPGITFGELARGMDATGGTMAGWFTSLKKAVTSVKDGIGDVLKSTWETVGGSAGDAVRLVTDEKVLDGASRLGTAYATGGSSEGARSIIGGLTGGDGNAVDKLMSFISNLGSSFKAQATATMPMQAGMITGNTLMVMVGGGILLSLLLGRRR